VQTFRLLLLGLAVQSEGPICDSMASNINMCLLIQLGARTILRKYLEKLIQILCCLWAQ